MKDIPVFEGKSCSSVQEWIDDQKSHKCEHKHMVSKDYPMERTVGAECEGFGFSVGVRFPVLRSTLKLVYPDIQKMIKSADGRIKFCEKMNE